MENACCCRNKKKQDKRCAFIWLLLPLDLRLLIKERWIFSKIVKFSNFLISPGWIKKYKAALSKSDFAWFNSYFMRLVIVPLAANIGNLQPLISSANIFFLYDFYNVIIHNDFYSDLLLCNFRFFKDVEINGRKLFR